MILFDLVVPVLGVVCLVYFGGFHRQLGALDFGTDKIYKIHSRHERDEIEDRRFFLKSLRPLIFPACVLGRGVPSIISPLGAA